VRFNKFGNKKIVIDGHKFDSKLESKRWGQLKLLLAAGHITDLELQKRFLLLSPTRYQNRTIRAIHYKADFSYMENGDHVVEDVKGFVTDVFKIKYKLFIAMYPHIDFRILTKENV